MIAKVLLALSAAVFAATGVAYLAVPGLALGIVGIESTPVSEFLLRTEGVALLFGAVIVWAVRGARAREHQAALVALSGYYVLSSLVDLAAFAQAIVGPASVPSAIARIAIGGICLAAVWYDRRRLPA